MTEKDKQTELKIFEAATDIFEEKGLDGARMQDIADRAGINKALLHYYYRTKDKLFAAVFERLAQKMFKNLFSIFTYDMPVEEKIEHYYREHTNFLSMNPRLPLFILREVNRNPELVDKFIAGIDIEEIKRGMQKNIGQGDTDDIMMTHLMISIISLSIFPFVARPVIERVLKAQGIDYSTFIDQRKDFAPRFIIAGINGMVKQGDF